MLFKTTMSGNSPVVKQHSRYRKEFPKSLSEEECLVASVGEVSVA